MVKFILIKKEGTVHEKRPKVFNEDEMYKYAGFKTPKDFSKVHDFVVDDYHYNVYAKDKGKANTENKYELPPPIDNNLYFGSICIVKFNREHEFCDLVQKEWLEVYEKLFGGFEDIGDESESRSQDSEIYSDEDYTSDGYLKDGFVVDDNDELKEESYLSYDSETE